MAVEANPYEAPAGERVAASPDSLGAAREPMLAFLRAAGVLAAAVGAMALLEYAGVDSVGWSALIFIAAVVVSARIAWRGAGRGFEVLAARRSVGLGTGTVFVLLLASIGNAGISAFGGLVAFVATTGLFVRGRQIRRRGRVVLPPLGEARDWAPARTVRDAARVPAGVAQAWRENGRTEHASVAAFARLGLDLAALGAPPHLVERVQDDARDEIHHALDCFGLARALDGAALGPVAFPELRHARVLPRPRSLALARLAVDSLVDGALNEGLSARVVAALVPRCELPEVRAVLRGIAADEGRHSAHAWDVVAWCLDEGGEPVARALEGALVALPRRVRSDGSAAAVAGDWERYGLPGQALLDVHHAAAVEHLRARVRALAQARRARPSGGQRTGQRLDVAGVGAAAAPEHRAAEFVA